MSRLTKQGPVLTKKLAQRIFVTDAVDALVDLDDLREVFRRHRCELESQVRTSASDEITAVYPTELGVRIKVSTDLQDSETIVSLEGE